MSKKRLQLIFDNDILHNVAYTDSLPGIDARAHEGQFCELFSLTMNQIKTMLPLTTNLREAYKSGRDDEQNFIQNMALFIATILKEHG